MKINKRKAVGCSTIVVSIITTICIWNSLKPSRLAYNDSYANEFGGEIILCAFAIAIAVYVMKKGE